MEAARAAISKITSRTGHRTDVDEVVNPAVTSETVKPHRHEETTEAIDREVHQHHYHTTVQPISHTETIPEKHTHNLVPQVHREFKHDNEAETSRRVATELGQFKDLSTTHETTHSTNVAPAVTGEHVHHHVHETVQPVIHKETVQPEVVHTTIPIHETHHHAAQHHGLSALPMKTLDEFKKAGGLITGGKSHTHEEYEGAPRPYNEKLMTTIEKVLPGHHGQGTTGTTGSTGLTGTHGTGTTGGLTDTSRGTGLTGTQGTTGGFNDTSRGSGLTGTQGTTGGFNDTSRGTGLTGTHGTGTTGGLTDTSRGTGLTGTQGTTGGFNDTSRGTGLTGTSGTTGTHGLTDNTHSPAYGTSGATGTTGTHGFSNTTRGDGLTGTSGTSGFTGRPDSAVGGIGNTTNTTTADKLNPRTDADGDGRRGVMD